MYELHYCTLHKPHLQMHTMRKVSTHSKCHIQTLEHRTTMSRCKYYNIQSVTSRSYKLDRGSFIVNHSDPVAPVQLLNHHCDMHFVAAEQHGGWGGDACCKVVDCYLLSFTLAPALALGRNRSLASKSGKRDALTILTPGNSSGRLLPKFIEAATAISFYRKNIS